MPLQIKRLLIAFTIFIKGINKMLFFLFLFTLIVFTGCKKTIEKRKEVKKEITEQKETKPNIENAVSSPPFSEGIFPCSDCHSDMKPNPIRRKLDEMHDDIDAMFNHDKENRWCLDCHDTQHRDSLKLASGKQLDFKESYKLCGQCHGDKYRDWKVGVHGKRTGNWNGQKLYLLCVNCHNPHSPKFKPLKPLPPPVRQKDIKF